MKVYSAQLSRPHSECFLKVDPAHHGPTHLTILPTYRCTAACAQCCFESNPHVQGRIPIERILGYIDQAARDFPTLKLVVFSGGECFLLRDDLDAAIARAAERGLATRCVTNGYWATSKRAAAERIAPLYEAGLSELNFSTGDDHQKFVPFDRIVFGATTAAEFGLRALIVVEGRKEARFTMDDVLAHADLAEFLRASPARANLLLLNNIWIPFQDEAPISQPDEAYRSRDRIERFQGCDNVLENMVITPHERLASCCGLTFEHIPEMKIGDARARSLRELYDSQLEDFIKIWIRVEGPEKIFLFATQKDPGLPFPDGSTHPCQTCAALFLNPRVRRVLGEHYLEKVPEVMFRYQMLRTLERRSDPSFAPATPPGPGTSGPEAGEQRDQGRIGFGA
ncbi:MAG: radical SAM protein [Acidobacteria bacterium]|nr:radical SAM protein [Acidobacteriota bacterium]